MSDPNDLAPGSLFNNKYRVTRLLGRGGMGSVFLAENVDIGRTVAIKVLRSEVADDPEVLARFKQEARAAAAIGHPGIVEVLDLGSTPEGSPFIVMEALEGGTLRDVLQQVGTLTPTQAALMLAEVLDTLSIAHDKGIVHRDLKPDNIFLLKQPLGATQTKILDFGISKFRSTKGGENDVGLTRAGVVMGTPLYMSPEQAKGSRDVGPSADVYSAGAILYEALSGQPPFPGESYNEVLIKVVTEPQRPLSQLRADVPEAMASLIDAMLAKQPAWRPPDARAAAFALRQSVGLPVAPTTQPLGVPAAQMSNKMLFDTGTGQTAVARTGTPPPVATQAPAPSPLVTQPPVRLTQPQPLTQPVAPQPTPLPAPQASPFEPFPQPNQPVRNPSAPQASGPRDGKPAPSRGGLIVGVLVVGLLMFAAAIAGIASVMKGGKHKPEHPTATTAGTTGHEPVVVSTTGLPQPHGTTATSAAAAGSSAGSTGGFAFVGADLTQGATTAGSTGGAPVVTTTGGGGTTGGGVVPVPVPVPVNIAVTNPARCGGKPCQLYATTEHELLQLDPDAPARVLSRCTYKGAIKDAPAVDIAQEASGRLLVLAAARLFSVNPSNCATLIVGIQAVSPGAPWTGLATVEKTIVAADAQGNVSKLSPPSGKATPLGAFGGGLGCSGDLVVRSDGTGFAIAHSAADASGPDLLVRLDTRSWAATKVGALDGAGYSGLAYVGGSLVATDSRGRLVRVDPNTGACQALSATNGMVYTGASSAPSAE